MRAKKGMINSRSTLGHMRSFAENSSIHGKILKDQLYCLSSGVQYFLSKSIVNRFVWFILVILALAGAAYFSENIFTDWQVVVIGTLVAVVIIITVFGRTIEL